MNNETTTTYSRFPARIDGVFRALRMGRHLCRSDGEDYFDLQRNEEQYRAVFAALGYELAYHDQGFFYFTGESTLRSQRLRAVTLFLLILFQDLEDRKFTQPERSWERTLLDRRFVIHDLPHFGTAQRRVMMDAVGVTPDNLDTKLLRFMTQLGLIETPDQTAFHFRAPVYRFVDLFMRYADDEQWTRLNEAAEADPLANSHQTELPDSDDGPPVGEEVEDD
jgi:chromosome condensin MukBEF MukE localization factor